MGRAVPAQSAAVRGDVVTMAQRSSTRRGSRKSLTGLFCWPGPGAKVRAVENALVVYLDPLILTLPVPSVPGGPKMMVDFLRELAREAARAADAIDSAEPTRRAAGDQS